MATEKKGVWLDCYWSSYWHLCPWLQWTYLLKNTEKHLIPVRSSWSCRFWHAYLQSKSITLCMPWCMVLSWVLSLFLFCSFILSVEHKGKLPSLVWNKPLWKPFMWSLQLTSPAVAPLHWDVHSMWARLVSWMMELFIKISLSRYY